MRKSCCTKKCTIF